MKPNQDSSFPRFINNPSNKKSEFTVLVPLQDVEHSKTLLPPAIRAANRQDGKIILLNVIEIPYQLPPSEAEQFILEREFKLEFARQIIKTAGCEVEVMVRIAHQLSYAIKQLSYSLDIDLIIMWASSKGLVGNKEIYQKLYDVNSNLLVAKELGETYFSEVIIEVNSLQTVNTMMEHATYLLGSKKGTIQLIPICTEKNEISMLRRLRLIVNRFHRQNHGFLGKTIINHLQPKSAAKTYLPTMHHKGIGSTGVLVSCHPAENVGAGTWLMEEAKKLDLPVFLSKVCSLEAFGIDQITNKLKKLIGIAS